MNTHHDTIVALHATHGVALTRPITADSLAESAEALAARAPTAARALRLYSVGYQVDADGYALEVGPVRLRYHEMAREIFAVAGKVAAEALAPAVGSAEDIERRGSKLAGITASALELTR